MFSSSPNPTTACPSGVLLIDKPQGVTSFYCVHGVRKCLRVEKVGHAGTLDPFATGLLIILVGKEWTRQQDIFMCSDKEYQTTITLGVATDTFDIEGEETDRSERVPTLQEVEEVLLEFQGDRLQTPPMFSAKKVQGKRLYDLARKGIQVEREPVPVRLETKLIEYSYPYLRLHIRCSKGTYIRSIGDEIGRRLGCCGHLSSLRRVRSGEFSVEDAISFEEVQKRNEALLSAHLIHPIL